MPRFVPKLIKTDATPISSDQDYGKRELKLYIPLSTQRRIHYSKTKYNIVNWGRQSGKTTYGLNKILGKSWNGPKDGVYWYILQTYSACQVVFRRLMKFYHNCPNAFFTRPTIGNMHIQFSHGPQIFFKSGKNYQDLRAETLNGVVVDEFRQQHPELWGQVLYPMLVHHDAWCDILSTPNGYDHFYDLFHAAKKSPNWSTFHAPSTEAPWWTPDKIEEAMRTMSQGVLDQEIYALFRNIQQGLAYLSHGEHNQLTTNPFGDYDSSHCVPFLPIILTCDFNINPMAWLLIQFNNDIAYAFKELCIQNTNTQEAALVFCQLYKQNGWKNTIWITGDATAKSKKTSSKGANDYDIICDVLRSNDIPHELMVPDGNPLVRDRVNAINGALLNSRKFSRFFYNPQECPMFKKDLDRVVWKTGDMIYLDEGPDKSLTHISDAAGYFVHQFMSIVINEDMFAAFHIPIYT